MKIKFKDSNFELDIPEQIMSHKIAIDTLLSLLVSKGFTTQVEYDQIRQKVIDEYNRKYPGLDLKIKSTEK